MGNPVHLIAGSWAYTLPCMRARTLTATVLALLLLASTGSGLFLPRYVELSVASQLSAPPDVLFPILETPSEWATWAPWTAHDSAASTVTAAVPSAVPSATSVPISGVGAAWSWRSEQGEGTLRITQAVPSVVLDYEVTIGVARPSYGAIRLAPNAGGTMVYWSMTADVGFSPIARWRGVQWPDRQRPVIESALARLDRYAATKPAASPILGREIPGLLELTVPSTPSTSSPPAPR